MQSIIHNDITSHGYAGIVEIIDDVGMERIIDTMEPETLHQVFDNRRSNLDLVYQYLRKASEDLIV
jgi:hypothetical protein